MNIFLRMNKKWRVFLMGILCIVVFYIVGFVYYSNHFVLNTRVGNISIANQSVAHAKKYIEQKMEEYSVEMIENNQSLGAIAFHQLNATFNIEGQLNALLEKQHAAIWPMYLIGQTQHDIQWQETFDFSDEMMSALRNQIGLSDSNRHSPENAYVKRSETEGYIIEPEVYGNTISNTSLKRAFKQAFLQQAKKVDMKEGYEQPEIKANDNVLSERLAKLDRIQNTQITLTFDGNSVTIPKAKIAEWLSIDDTQEPLIDEEAIQQYLGELNREYAGVFKTRQFESTYQGTVTVQPGTYGWFIKVYDEAEAIKEDLQEARNVTREPAIGGSGYGVADDIGGSYVEVDLSNQMMWIYHDRIAVFSTPIVSGRVGAETVPGAYQVWEKKADTNLTGYNPFYQSDYSQPVDYWIAFDDNSQGIHDASWQSSFGGSNYVNHGSLGCINTPPYVMGEVFQLVDYGMPVIIYW